MKMKKALITGITGMVGSHLTDYLLAHTDWDVHGMCRWRSPLDNMQHLLNRANKKDRLFFHYADLADALSLFNLIETVKPDYVFHLAAQSYPQTSFTAPDDTLNININGTTRLLEALKKYQKDAIIHVCASSEVFGRVPKEFVPIHEEVPFHPASPYAISKVGTDLVGRFYAEAYDMTVMTTRMFTHTGPRRGDVFAESTFAKQIAMIEAELMPPIIQVGNLNSMRTWSDVRDAVRAYYMLVTVNPVRGSYYNIGGDYSCSISDMLNYLVSLSPLKNKIEIAIDASRLRPIDADLQVPDTTKFREHTGWVPEIKFEQTMQDLLNYWRERISLGYRFLNR
jgi:GDP-mannose 4,6-dehydratase